MFSTWDFLSWLFSLGIVLFVFTLLTSFSALVSVLMCRMWGEVRDDAATARASEPPKEPPMRKAA
jgi:hypothetical protein